MPLYRCVDCHRYAANANANAAEQTCPVCGGLLASALERVERAESEPEWLEAYRRDMERDLAASAQNRPGRRAKLLSLLGRARHR